SVEKKALPLPEWAPPWWTGVALLVGWVGISVGALAIEDDVEVVADIVGHFLIMPAAGVVILFLCGLQRWRFARYEREARKLGLTFRPRVYEADLDRGLSLFALTEGRRHWAGYLMKGKFHGQRVTLFDYGFSGQFRTVEDRTVTWAGQQTVFVVPGAEALPDF